MRIFCLSLTEVLGSIVVSIPACHAGDRGSIPRRGGNIFDFRFHNDLPITIFSFSKNDQLDITLKSKANNQIN